MPRRRASAGHKLPSGKIRPSSRRQKPHSEAGRMDDSPSISLTPEDKFYANRDKILLEEMENGRDAYDDDTYEDEIFALKDVESDSEEENHSPPPASDGISSYTRKPGSKKNTLTAISNADSSHSTSDSENENEGWGKKKSAYYSTNIGEPDSEDEETSELYLQESLRLQKKARTLLADIDFDYNDQIILDIDRTQSTGDGDKEGLGDFSRSDASTRIRLLERHSPELIALARDWESVVKDLIGIEDKIERYDSKGVEPELGLLHLYHQILLTYITTLAFYLHLATGNLAVKRLRSHPILARLLALREASMELQLLDLGGDSSDLDIGESDGLYEDEEQAGTSSSLDETDSLSARLQPATASSSVESDKQMKRFPSRIPNTSNNQTKLETYELQEPSFQLTKSKPYFSDFNGQVSHFGDQTSLQEFDAMEKKVRKRSLMFHTARVDSDLIRRADARATKGGDEDIPYPERKKGQVTFRSREAITTPQEQLSGESIRNKRPREDQYSSGEEQSDDGYYELVKRQKGLRDQEKISKRQAESSSSQYALAEEAPGGPRTLTRAILTNKGIASRQFKRIRNPRVKKRLQYEKAQRKISSQKAVYKGGSANGHYPGEMSGISSRTVKSVRL